MATSQRDFVCPRCWTLSTVAWIPSLCCPYCQLTISRSDYEKRIESGRRIAKYGVQYRRLYEKEFKKHGKLRSRASLADPSLIVAFLASSAASGIAWDVMKGGLQRLAKSLKERRHKNGADSNSKISAQDLNYVHELLGNKEKTDNLVADVADFMDKMPTVAPEVRDAIISEGAIEQIISSHQRIQAKIAAANRDTTVYVSPSGTRFHLKNCSHLRGIKLPLSAEAAVKKYLPCDLCFREK